MQCKQCWIWRQAVDSVKRELADLEKYKGKLLRIKRKSPTVEKLIKTLDETQNYKFSRQERLTEIGDKECRPDRCILCDLGKEVNDGFPHI